MAFTWEGVLDNKINYIFRPHLIAWDGSLTLRSIKH